MTNTSIRVPTRAQDWIPVPNLFPISSFPSRLVRKCKLILHYVLIHFGTKHGFFGAKVVSITSDKNLLVRLNRDYPLGSKGTILELPRDRVIFESVRQRGVWEIDESEFLAHSLKKSSQQSASRIAFLDIGANTGLVSLQAMNLAETDNEVFLFEPVPSNAIAIRRNLSSFKGIHVNVLALSDKNEKSQIYTEATNRGKTSMLNSIISPVGQIVTDIELVDTEQFCNEFLTRFDCYVIKCDTEGMDALILSRIPIRIWKSVECAVIEVWALPSISALDVDKCLSMFEQFNFISWNSKSCDELTLNDVKDFWLSKTSLQKNLFLRRTL